MAKKDADKFLKELYKFIGASVRKDVAKSYSETTFDVTGVSNVVTRPPIVSSSLHFILTFFPNLSLTVISIIFGANVLCKNSNIRQGCLSYKFGVLVSHVKICRTRK